MTLSKGLKLAICARAFYQDNKDEYEDYHEAKAEFMAADVSDRFVDFTVSRILEPECGHKIFANSDGHVGTVRMADGFFSPRTEMTEDEANDLHERFFECLDSNEDLEPLEAFIKIGWVEVKDGN